MTTKSMHSTGADNVPFFATKVASGTSSMGTDDAPLFARPSALGDRSNRRMVAMGWSPDLPDFRDFTLQNDQVRNKLKDVDSLLVSDKAIPPRHDNIDYCSPIENQGKLGSCTAQAVVGMMEYMMRRGGINHINGSRLFVYKMTRKLLKWTGDQGGYLRKAIQAVSIFGVPPEEHWPYEIERYEEEPAAFHYAYADSFRALNYARLDPYGMPPEEILTTVKRTICAGYAVVFGFTVFSSLTCAPDIALPDNNDSAWGGHAVMAVGYDDHHAVNGQTVPSLVIRNSWGRDWGYGGYGFLPYDYLLCGLARDFWSCFKWGWVDTKRFN